MRAYPHELSGGMQQRAAIALGIQNEPRLLLADEPTTALDMTIQAQLLKLPVQLRAELGTATPFATHHASPAPGICPPALLTYPGHALARRAVSACSAPCGGRGARSARCCGRHSW